MNSFEKGWTKIKQRFEEDPITVIMVGSVAATGAAHLINAMSGVQSRRAYAKKFNKNN